MCTNVINGNVIIDDEIEIEFIYRFDLFFGHAIVFAWLFAESSFSHSRRNIKQTKWQMFDSPI